jgi:hypothetical protein
MCFAMQYQYIRQKFWIVYICGKFDEFIGQSLASFGVDIEKPWETSPLEPDENGMLEYCVCQYIVFGSCPDTYKHRIGDVEFRLASCYPGTEIEEEHFVLEFYPVRLKFICSQ